MVNISDLINKKINKKDIDVVLDLKEFNDNYETYKVLEPIRVKATLTKQGDVISILGLISGKIQLTCSRCLQNFSYELQLELQEKLTNNPENKDDEIIFINNDKLELTEIVENNIIMSLPIQRLCKEDCKGLCQVCGTNLNKGSCNCDNPDIDPRLAGLKDLFSNN
ncbi:hypothetical protein CPAST_c20810 [Clostridium pasteurianum DSM 525 = ATCC 6013]|uniref:Metal-binding protein n=1 Tax=Clostridium pasteurianum DSM 525 = ATCC 6013 TaxID=1262449 RepID=A0A0H3J2J8_CLOPA|nr:DUF177 domain-containing protein [Clostridium pasteurianum]AJA48151.1 hypothetical protein CPAST_c20810 [Clostridium pasteurianum DSM 525 = ATCC 6013]AJA52139.1 hypothetical protein CLPA_c20810 [Clostridium pasteurianum DSM 525 = ATCC 6013]AOZ75413.1 DNA-binding protein [Clostridium pasteurianum DSM 525 = ATCC 6013]AOZ79208.1 DNA-binding protein [Clostridium pasteurianum]ELP60697.1 Zn-finger-like protein, possible nucleic acid binding protein [Clostridium pasteurianum DSM 525 = ATCC 6013]